VLELEESLRGGFEGIVEVFAFLETPSEMEAGSIESRCSVADAFAAFTQVFSGGLEELISG